MDNTGTHLKLGAKITTSLTIENEIIVIGLPCELSAAVIGDRALDVGFQVERFVSRDGDRDDVIHRGGEGFLGDGRAVRKAVDVGGDTGA